MLHPEEKKHKKGVLIRTAASPWLALSSVPKVAVVDRLHCIKEIESVPGKQAVTEKRWDAQNSSKRLHLQF